MENNGIYSQRLRAGRRRTYFFDVRTTKSEDYYITITESKKRFEDDGYDRHKIFVYKEDFNKFVMALSNTVDYVKEKLMPEYDFNEFDRQPEEYVDGVKTGEEAEQSTPQVKTTTETVEQTIEQTAEETAEEVTQEVESGISDSVSEEVSEEVSSDEDLSF